MTPASVVLGALLLVPALAQEAPPSRARAWAELQGKKSAVLRPPQPDKAEALVRRLERALIETPSGFYPLFSSIYHGGGLTLGAGYRSFYGDNTSWSIGGMYSVKNYKLVEVATQSKDHLDRRLTFGARLGWRDATQVAYYGLGMHNSLEDRANFRFQQTYGDGNARFKPVWWLPIRAGLGLERWVTKEGQGGYRSIETAYTPETAPGLGASPVYLHSQFSAGIDWRPAPGYTRRGGLYQATLHDYRNNEGGTYSFQMLEGDAVQHLPIYRESWVLAARGRVVTTLNDNNLIPYFLLPSLGDGSSLRAFATDRFRDRHSLLMSAEIRWIPTSAVDMAVFYDAGKVAPHRHDLSFKGLKSDVGIGIRFHGLVSTPLRLDLAHGNEGWNLVIGGSAVF